jgi:hypothetical protein
MMSKREFIVSYVLAAAVGTSGNGNWSQLEPRTIVERAEKTWRAVNEVVPEEKRQVNG